MRARKRVWLDDVQAHARVAHELVGQIADQYTYDRGQPIPHVVADLYMRIGQLQRRLRDGDPRARDRWWRWRTR